MVLPLKTTLVMSQVLIILHLKNIHTEFFTLNVIECIAHACLFSNDKWNAALASSQL